MKSDATVAKRNIRIARERWGRLPRTALIALRELTHEYRLSLALGDLLYLDQHWYVSHSGLLRIAQRKKCCGIEVECIDEFSDPSVARWAFKATVFTFDANKGFVGYGDADPSNVSAVVRGAEMRVAETRAVNRALRKAYGIGICSVEELGSITEPLLPAPQSKKPVQPVNGNGKPKLRDRLCQIIRHYQLDPNLVKCYATDFCGVKSLREASREQIETFVGHLADWAEKDRNALLCQLNSYVSSKQGAA